MCRKACWHLDANVPHGGANACLFAMLVLRCPASEKAALHLLSDKRVQSQLQKGQAHKHANPVPPNTMDHIHDQNLLDRNAKCNGSVSSSLCHLAVNVVLMPQ